ncbi:MAG: type II toxin-antitoxin system prevent-host-death family antitoxin [Gemmatimonadaceae bacterium]
MSNRRLPATKARERLAEVLNEVSVRGDRIILERHGKNVAAVISMEDLELLERLEDRYDLDLAKAALSESEERIPWDQVNASLTS